MSSTGVQGNFSSHAPALSADGRSVAFDSDTTNLVAGDHALLVFGFAQFPGGVELGPLLAMPGCLSFHSPDIFIPATAGGPGTASWTWSPVSGFRGATWYGQALCLDPTVNPFGWTVSNAIYASIGG